MVGARGGARSGLAQDLGVGRVVEAHLNEDLNQELDEDFVGVAKGIEVQGTEHCFSAGKVVLLWLQTFPETHIALFENEKNLASVGTYSSDVHGSTIDKCNSCRSHSARMLDKSVSNSWSRVESFTDIVESKSIHSVISRLDW